jgi:hypothetical protein
MVLHRRRVVAGVMLLVVFVLLASCGPFGNASDNGKTGTGSTPVGGSTAQGTPATAITPLLITPKASSGSPGKAPLVITSQTPVPGGGSGSQLVVLLDRTLTIYSASKHQGTSTNSTSIDLDLAVQNTSGRAIANHITFFQLMGPEGDIFGYQNNSSDTFYGTIAAHTTRRGAIEFQVPAAAKASLRLLYRPEIATETAIILLNVA